MDRLMTDPPSSGSKQRLDEAIVARGLLPTRSRARDAVLRGSVKVDGVIASRPGMSVAETATITLDDPAADYVSRGAVKLLAALDAFGFDPKGRVCVDLGASTGGFTQVLLKRGAALVYAIDVGHGQLHPSLTADPRVRSLEGVNARDLEADAFDRPIEAVVADLSFISLTLALPPALTLAAPDAWLVALIKPQFEVGKAAVGKGGIVRDPIATAIAVDRMLAWATNLPGWKATSILPSPIKGGDGNAEFLLGARKSAPPVTP
jgi:23S rRNA (cytidine1920-2'-O)/16S rRNA (cytidine1409-2'-O)-methyltransferase